MPIGSAADFGSTVRALRKQRGWTQRQLADLCGCSIMYVSNLERGKETAELGLALRILNRLSYDPHGDRPARPHRGAAMSVLEDCVPGETPAPAPAPSVPAAPPADPRAAADAAFMRLALEQAALAAEVDEVPIGAVVVYEGRVIAAAHNRRELDEDPSAHAEFSAMVAAARALGHWRLTG
jgi:transcriptional regulator with XRE-family HTH domain